jgi:hypothetical protein
LIKKYRPKDGEGNQPATYRVAVFYCSALQHCARLTHGGLLVEFKSPSDRAHTLYASSRTDTHIDHAGAFAYMKEKFGAQLAHER